MTEQLGPVHARLVLDHDDLDTFLDELILAYESNDRELAAAAYRELEERIRAHFELEEDGLFPDFARIEPRETEQLRAEHAAIRARVEELGIGVDLHATRIGAIRELAQMLRRHAARENALLYRWADRILAGRPGHTIAEVAT